MLRTGAARRTQRLDVRWRVNTLGHPRLGLMVPRYGNTIVARNRLRRRLRDIARRRVLPGLRSVDVVIRSRLPAYRSTFQTLTTDLEQWARSLSD